MSTHIYPDQLMTPIEVADVLGVTENTLSVWRCTSRYPLPWVKIGSKVLYRAEDVSKFITAGLRQSVNSEISTESGGR